jgi:dTDP-4-dehydrorhamnose reductase
MKVLVTGANGLLGPYLVDQLLRRSCLVVASGKGPSRLGLPESAQFSYRDLDLTQSAQVREFISSERPEVVFHAAAMTQVDFCEQSQDACFELNVTATACLLESAKPFCSHFIYVSTDFVFDGTLGHYREEDPTGAVNWYGHTKLIAEGLVKESGLPWTIARTCLVYGNNLTSSRSNIVGWVVDQLQKNNGIKVVDDQLRTPTYVEDLATGLVLILEKKAMGIFHLSGSEDFTPFRMATQVAEHLKLNSDLIEKVDQATFQQVARRPQKTGFDIRKARKELGFEPRPFLTALTTMYAGD